MADLDKAFSLMPGTKKLNLHASYAIFEEGEFADRDKLEPRHFAKWVAFAKERGIRWDSDHVVLLDDETMEIAKEVVRCNALDRVYLSLDYFDASINRISAWVTGFRSLQKALLHALTLPHDTYKKLQDENQMSRKMVAMEDAKMLPFSDVWEEYCRVAGVPAGGYYDEIEAYEKEALLKRI